MDFFVFFYIKKLPVEWSFQVHFKTRLLKSFYQNLLICLIFKVEQKVAHQQKSTTVLNSSTSKSLKTTTLNTVILADIISSNVTLPDEVIQSQPKRKIKKIEKVAGGQIVLINDIVDYHFDVLIICIIVVLIASLPLCITLLVTWQRMKENFKKFG